MIFDMDGTLYQFKEGSFKKSKLQKIILKRAQQFIKKKLNITKRQTKQDLNKIIAKYGENISIGLEKEYGLSRSQYFNYVWNLPPKLFIKKQPSLRKKIINWNKYFCILLLSDSPKVWIENVLKELGIFDLFQDKIISGEGNNRKIFINVFPKIITDYKIMAKDCLVVGDQEETDIIPAKNIGMTTVFVSNNKKSEKAYFNIKNIFELDKIIKQGKHLYK
ncbi:MAG: HAD family hydrolase [Patescibacteria group bacterium]